MSELEDSRRRKDQVYGHDPQPPQSPDQRRTFDGLRYYPEKAALRFHAPIDTDVSHDVIEVDTTTGSKRTYIRAGKVTFEVDGQAATIHLYSSGDQHELLVPFRDATSGKATYGGGRYLDLALGDDGTVALDFNYAYNPYCAYNEGWTCPIPPVENWLTVPIEAGELLYDESDAGHP